jgi:hypothetical protein
LHGGHYTATANQNGKWCDFNDSFASENTSFKVSSSAYVLFYEKVGDIAEGREEEEEMTNDTMNCEENKESENNQNEEIQDDGDIMDDGKEKEIEMN